MPAALAQTAPASADSGNDEDIIQLSDFVVTTERTAGYRATNAITATGIGAQIGETPLAISVVTNELMQDASAFEMREALNFVPGVLTNPRSESAVTIRGFGGLISYRNGQYRRQLLTDANYRFGIARVFCHDRAKRERLAVLVPVVDRN